MTGADRSTVYDEDGRRRWDELVEEMTSSGQVASAQLDLSASSLEVVWRWLLPRLRQRPPDEPVVEGVQPPWWSGPTWKRYAGWDDVSHHRISAVAHHLRQVLLARPDATVGLGEAGTVDAGEPVVVFADRPDVNPLREVKVLLADVWDARADPASSARVVARPQALAPEVLYPTRLVLRVRAPVSGVFRRRRHLDTPTVVRAMSQLLGRPLGPLAAGTTVEHLGAGDWRAVIALTGDAARLREVTIVVGAPRDEPVAHTRGPAVRELLGGLLTWAEQTGSEVDVVEAVPDDQHAARPTGRISASELDAVLRTVGL